MAAWKGISLKIDNSVKPVAGVTPAEATGRFSTGTSGGPQRAERPDGAAASESFSSELKAIEHDLATAGVVDRARVDAIKQAISEGRLKINPGAIADKLLEATRELLENAKGAS
jgi:negative regulator of flagellin synthesis FlgM